MISDLPDGNFIIDYTDGTMDYAQSVIYALGASYRSLPEKVTNNIPIHYCALCDGSLYKDKTVAIIGGGDVAFTQAEYLSKICKEVNIVMCDRNVTAAPQTFDKVSKIENVYILYDYPIEEMYTLPTEHIHRYGLKPCGFDKYSNYCLLIDGVFVAIGMVPNTQQRIVTSKIITDTLGYIIANEDGKTALDGFFAAGDVRAKSMRQSITAASDGANAVNSVTAYLARRETNENS